MTFAPSVIEGAGLEMVPVEFEESFVPKSLPQGWQRLQAEGPAFLLDSVGNPHHRIIVLMSVTRELDRRLWLHVSVSHPKRMPGWEDLSMVKRLFIGERYAYQVHYQVHPPSDSYFTLKGEGRRSREGKPPLPDFFAARERLGI